MSTALELVKAVEANGGCLSLEGEWLVVRPAHAGRALAPHLRRHKAEIVNVLRAMNKRLASEAFGLWLLEQCVFRHCCLGGVAALHLDFAVWCRARSDSTQVLRCQFEQILEAEGFMVDRSASTVYGLVLIEDYEAALGYAAPKPGISGDYPIGI